MVIRDVVIHMSNEQPMLADIEAMPTAADACLMCTNLRYLNGKKPVWTDAIDSWFMLPIVHLRFVEVPRTSLGQAASGTGTGLIALGSGMVDDGLDPDDALDLEDEEPDEELLRRVREA